MPEPFRAWAAILLYAGYFCLKDHHPLFRGMVGAVKYDVVIPYHPKDEEILLRCVASLRKYATAAATIFIVSAAEPPTKVMTQPNVKWIPESAYPMSIHDVQSILQSTKGREGWYYQQFLKLYCFDAIPGLLDKVLLFDSDVVLFEPIEFVNAADKILLDWGYQYNHPYFEHATALLGDRFRRILRRCSGITDHIVTTRAIVTDLLAAIEAQHPGKPAWKTILELIPDRDRNGAGFSEYELLFNWTFMYFPAVARARKLLWKREIAVFHHYLRGSKT